MISKQHLEETPDASAPDLRSNERHVSTEDLFRAYAPFVARLLSRMGIRPHELDDAVQEVFLAAHKNGGYAPGPAKPSTYLARIALHTALGERRRLRRQWARHSERPPEELASSVSDPARLFETQEAFGEVDRALSKLSPTLRATLWLADAEGESCVSIAAASEVPVGTVYWRLDRARKQFRDALRRSDAQRTPRRALGIFLLWGREAEAAESLAEEVRHVLSGFRRLVPTHYDAARGLSRLHLALSTAGATKATVVGTLSVAKGIAALSAVCVAVVSGSSLSRPAEPTGARVAVSAAHAAAPDLPPSTASAPAASDVSLLAPEGGGDQVAPPSERPLEDDGREARRLDRRSTRAARRAMAALGAVTPAPAGARAEDPAAPSTATSDQDAKLALEDEESSPSPADDPVVEAQVQKQPSASEAAQVAHAARLLEAQPRAALAAVRALPTGDEGAYLLEEREYIEVMALFSLGERAEGAQRADAFLRRYPSSAFSRTIRKVRATRS